jgi:uroporphyrin-III C-methyltransferase
MKTRMIIENKQPANILMRIALLVLVLAIIGLLGYGYLTVSRLNKMQNELQQEVKVNEIAVQHLLDLSNAGTNIALPQIEYLIKLANIDLTLNNNIPLAIRALQTADNAAAKLSDPAIVGLRRALQHDIGALQAATVVDVPGIMMRLDNVSDQVANLPIIPEALPKAAEQNSAKQNIEPAVPPQSMWQKFYHFTLAKLSNIIVIQHHEQPVPALLSASEQIYLAQNIQLLLDQAKWSVLYDDADIYSQSLVRANKMVKIYFSHNQTVVDKLSNELQDLQKINLKPTIPDISMSIKAIDNLTNAARKG